jgi:hypothetical protein
MKGFLNRQTRGNRLLQVKIPVFEIYLYDIVMFLNFNQDGKISQAYMFPDIYIANHIMTLLGCRINESAGYI